MCGPNISEMTGIREDSVCPSVTVDTEKRSWLMRRVCLTLENIWIERIGLHVLIVVILPTFLVQKSVRQRSCETCQDQSCDA
jgi:hypothetical protein